MALDPGGGFGSPSSGIPHDWTEGTGVLPTGGITIPNPSITGQSRKWLLIQNQSAVTLSVNVQATTNGGASVLGVILVASGGGIGVQGGSQEFGLGSWTPTGQVTVTGAAGSQCCVLEILE